MTATTQPQLGPTTTTACGKEFLIARRGVVLAQAAAIELKIDADRKLVRALKEEAALLAKEAASAE